MQDANSHVRGYAVAALLGALAGGLGVAIVTRAIPKMAAAMMQNMMAHMREGGCNPQEM